MAVIKINGLPAFYELEKEGWKFEDNKENVKQVLKIAVLNVMPLKEQTERQLIRRMAASSQTVEVTFLTTETYRSTHVDPQHLQKYYKTFSMVRDEYWDGLIITGAPVEHMAFEDVAYWQELSQIIEWSKTNVRSVLYICWGAQVGLYYHHGIIKRQLPQKQFGIYPHDVTADCPLTYQMESPFVTPHSRHTYTAKEDVLKVPELIIAGESSMAGVYLVLDQENRRVYVTGHSEYEADTLEKEYRRDLAKGLPIQIPYNYFPEDDDTKTPVSVWQKHSETLFDNWLTFYAAPN